MVPAPDWVGGPRAVVDAVAADHDLVVVIEALRWQRAPTTRPWPRRACVRPVGLVIAQLPSPGSPRPGSVVLTVAEDER
ncbi:MAG: hypothetical protein R2713_01095 [Ilumatobacteraceae bacterium]